MSPMQNRQKATQKRLHPQEIEPHVLSSRKLRHGKRKMPITTLISTGLVIFGTLFIGLFLIELYQAKNSAVEKEKVTIGDASSGTDSTLSKPEQPNPAESSSTPVQTAPINNTVSTNANSVKPAASSGENGKSTPRQQPAQPTGETKNGGTKPAGSSQPSKSGQGKTVTPAATVNAGGTGTTPETAAAKQKVERYIVQKGDTLFSISRKYYGNNSGVERITRYNGIKPDTQLKEGKELTIPLPQ